MKIEGWDKINGFTYKGYVICNAEYDLPGNCYHADIMNLNDSNSREVYLTLWPTQQQDVHILRISSIVASPNSIQVQKGLTTDKLRNLRMFRIHYEGLIEELILLSTKQTSNKVSGTTGIINQVQNAGTNVTYSSHSISNGLSNLSVMQQALNAMRELEEQLDELKKQYPL
jgi:hypothetical protein